MSKQEETHSLREWAQILAKNPDLRAEFDKMCPPQPIQGSIAPDADLDAEIFAWQKAHATEETKQIIAMTSRHFAEWERERIAARMRAALKKMNPGDVMVCVTGWITNLKLEHLKQ